MDEVGAVNAQDDPRAGASPLPVEAPEPWLAVLLTAFLPGTGHLYAGRVGKGWALWLGGLAVVWLPLLLGAGRTLRGTLLVLLAGLAYWVFLMVSAARHARGARGGGLGSRRWIAVLALAFCQIVVGNLLIRFWLPLRGFKIPSGSMEPTLLVGDFLIADQTAWGLRELRRGDLVIHESAEVPGRSFLKRVVALPGEVIEIRDKRVFIDGEPIEEPWAAHSDGRTYPASPATPPPFGNRDQYGPETVPEGTLFLLGDNRDNSNDSRFHGPVDRSLVFGRPLYIYWSTDRDRIGRSLLPPEPSSP